VYYFIIFCSVERIFVNPIGKRLIDEYQKEQKENAEAEEKEKQRSYYYYRISDK
jgi:hypothetical protein